MCLASDATFAAASDESGDLIGQQEVVRSLLPPPHTAQQAAFTDWLRSNAPLLFKLDVDDVPARLVQEREAEWTSHRPALAKVIRRLALDAEEAAAFYRAVANALAAATPWPRPEWGGRPGGTRMTNQESRKSQCRTTPTLLVKKPLAPSQIGRLTASRSHHPRHPSRSLQWPTTMTEATRFEMKKTKCGK